METQFKVGDVVQLLGTNSKATIIAINGDEYTIDCGKRHGQHKVTRMSLRDPVLINDWILRHMKEIPKNPQNPLDKTTTGMQ